MADFDVGALFQDPSFMQGAALLSNGMMGESDPFGKAQAVASSMADTQNKKTMMGLELAKQKMSELQYQQALRQAAAMQGIDLSKFTTPGQNGGLPNYDKGAMAQAMLQAGVPPEHIGSMLKSLPDASERPITFQPPNTGVWQGGTMLQAPGPFKIPEGFELNPNPTPDNPNKVIPIAGGPADQAQQNFNLNKQMQVEGRQQAQQNYEQTQAMLKQTRDAAEQDRLNRYTEVERQKLNDRVTAYDNTLKKANIPDAYSNLDIARNALAPYVTIDPDGTMHKKPGVNIPGFGQFEQKLSGDVLGLVSKEGLELRRALSGVKNSVMKDQNGKAVTTLEQQKTLTQLGQGQGMSDEMLINALNDYNKTVKNNANSFNNGAGYEVVNEFKNRGLATYGDMPKPTAATSGRTAFRASQAGQPVQGAPASAPTDQTAPAPQSSGSGTKSGAITKLAVMTAGHNGNIIVRNPSTGVWKEAPAGAEKEAKSRGYEVYK